MECPVCGAALEGAADACPRCGADLLLLAPGSVVAERYEIRAFLGRGGMGSVYRARDRVLDDVVALKIQRAEAGRGGEAERRFRTEVKLARQVSHPNVCRLHEGGQEGARRWISMELVEGETLAALLRTGGIAEERAFSLALQAADGLAAVHAAGVVHRDLKTLNLMVDGSGRLRLMDFGIAKPAAAAETGGGGYALGSPEYMSPEQARGRSADARSDVYSLGVVLFELFTGRVPFRAETPVATLLQHLSSPPPLDALPPPLRPVLGRALDKDPARRYAHAGEMAEALRAAREGRPAGAPVKAPLARWSRPLVAIFAALVLAGAFVSWRARLGPTRPAPPAPAATPSPLAGAGSSSPSAAGPSGALAAPPTSPPAEPAVRPPRPSPTIPAEDAPREASAPVGAVESEPPTAASPGPETAAPPPIRVPSPEPTPAATAPREGALLVVVRPWADVSVDGVPRGQTPLGRLALPPGPHQVLLTHPDYQPFPRRVTIVAGETFRLVVSLPEDGVRARR